MLNRLAFELLSTRELSAIADLSILEGWKGGVVMD